MPIQKRTVVRSSKPAEQKASAEANPLKATPFNSTAMKKTKKAGGFTATTMSRAR